MFNESEHPRAKNGKFTDGNGAMGDKIEKAVNVYSDNPEEDKKSAQIKKNTSRSPTNNDSQPSEKGSTFEITDSEKYHIKNGLTYARLALEREYDKLDRKEDLTSKEIEQLDSLRQSIMLYDGIIKKLDKKT